MFLDCGITAEGMKAISSFLSQNGINLEELNLGLNENYVPYYYYSSVSNKFGDEGCAHLVEGLKKNTTLKKLLLMGISSKQKKNLLLMNTSGCRITAEGTNSFSNFLSQDGIVLEELGLGLIIMTTIQNR